MENKFLDTKKYGLKKISTASVLFAIANFFSLIVCFSGINVIDLGGTFKGYQNLVSAIILLIALIFLLVGLVQAGRTGIKKFRTALIFFILNRVFTFVSLLLPDNTSFEISKIVVEIVTYICLAMATILIVSGLNELLNRVKNNSSASLGNGIIIISVIYMVFCIVVSYFSRETLDQKTILILYMAQYVLLALLGCLLAVLSGKANTYLSEAKNSNNTSRSVNLTYNIKAFSDVVEYCSSFQGEREKLKIFLSEAVKQDIISKQYSYVIFEACVTAYKNKQPFVMPPCPNVSKNDNVQKNEQQNIQQTSNLKENLELIKQLKELLDTGAITQEEYDEKKKELLGVNLKGESIKDSTLAYYNRNAENFINGTQDADMHLTQDKFLGLLKENSSILDFGCGSGRDTKYFLDKGYRVTATDGSEEICKLASEYTGVKVKQMLFQEFDEIDQYDGIWACSSILHLPKKELKPVLIKMINALHSNGVIYTSFKYGDFEGERNGRFFTDFTLETFSEFIDDIKEIKIEDSWITGDVRPGREDEKWLNLLLRKKD